MKFSPCLAALGLWVQTSLAASWAGVETRSGIFYQNIESGHRHLELRTRGEQNPPVGVAWVDLQSRLANAKGKVTSDDTRARKVILHTLYNGVDFSCWATVLEMNRHKFVRAISAEEPPFDWIDIEIQALDDS